jgi:heme exporter protein B
VDRSFIYLAKLFSFWIILTLTQLIILPCFTLFLSLDLSGQWMNVLIILAISNWAIAAVGILIAGICFHTPMGEILLPILLFPILSPVLIGAVRLTISLIQDTFVVNSFWFMLILTFSVCFTLAGFLIFDSISQD